MELDEDFDEVDAEKIGVDPSITPEIFAEWRSPRFGGANPERMNNPFWEWMIRTRLSAYQGNEKLNGPDSCTACPCWCFNRFGQSRTKLPDGREIFIAGEHEDFYDPDFYIYNDVIVKHPGGEIDIFGYPKEIFPPTDFHSATLVVGKIVLIGSVALRAERQPGVTQIVILDLENKRMSPRSSTGVNPGWISRHTATLVDDGNAILVTGGEIARESNSFVENIDEWKLDLRTMSWRRLTAYQWPRWAVYRADRRRNSLWEVTSALKYRHVKGLQKSVRDDIEGFEKERGCKLDFDLAAVLFSPDFPHEMIDLPDAETYNKWAILVNGVKVTYKNNGHEVVITAEGELDAAIAKRIATDFRDKISRLENRPYELREIASI